MTVGTLRAAAIAIAVVGLSRFALADSVVLNWNGVNDPSPRATVSTNLYSGSAGQMNWTTGAVAGGVPTPNPFAGVSSGTAVSTFCIQATSALNNIDTYTIDYVPFTLGSATLLTKLFAAYDNAGAGGALSDGNHAAAFQMAVWELIYDGGTGNTYSYNSNWSSTGVFQDHGTSSTILNDASTYLQNFQAAGANTTGWTLYELDAQGYLNHPGQDQIYATFVNIPNTGQPVPLPAAAPGGAALLVGLAAMRFWRRRRA